MLVRDLLLEILQDVDPVISGTDTPFSTATVGVQDGALFSKEDHIAFYNRARLSIYERLRSRATRRQLIRLFGSSMVRNTSYQFANGQGFRPPGYIELPFFSHKDIKEIILLPNHYQEKVLAKRDPRYKESEDRCFVFELSGDPGAMAAPVDFSDAAPLDFSDDAPVTIGDGGGEVIRTLSFFSLSTSTYLKNATDYTIVYIGIPMYALSDITGGTTNESFDTIFHGRIIDYTKRIAIQKNMIDANALNRAGQ